MLEPQAFFESGWRVLERPRLMSWEREVLERIGNKEELNLNSVK